MAGIKGSGFEELKANTEKLSKIIQTEALAAAEEAASLVIKRAVESGVRHSRTGTLKRSIRIFRGRSKGLTTTGQQNIIGRLLIGPEKRKGFYGFFLERGWNLTRAGRVIKKIPGTEWFSKAVRLAERAAEDAGKKAFEEVVNRSLR